MIVSKSVDSGPDRLGLNVNMIINNFITLDKLSDSLCLSFLILKRINTIYLIRFRGELINMPKTSRSLPDF